VTTFSRYLRSLKLAVVGLPGSGIAPDRKLMTATAPSAIGAKIVSAL
jgi:hypothetical protein